MFKKISVFYNENNIVINISVFSLLVIANILFFRTDEARPGINTWNDITIGKKLASDNLILQNPISVETDGDKTSYKIESGFKVYPNEVIVDKDQKVEFIKEYIIANNSHTLDQYIEELGEYDLERAVPSLGDSVTAGVFLDDGLVVVFQNGNSVVVQKWYFSPTSAENFIITWGTALPDKTIEVHF